MWMIKGISSKLGCIVQLKGNVNNSTTVDGIGSLAFRHVGRIKQLGHSFFASTFSQVNTSRRTTLHN